MNHYQIPNIVMNVTLITTFIGIFFFTYGKIIEQNVVQTQSEQIADYLAKDISTFIDKNTAKKIAAQLTLPDMTKEDKHVEEQNKKLQDYAFNILILVAISGLLFTIIYAKYYHLNIITILKTNLTILFFVALTEYIFLTYIGQNFISLDPNFVRTKILQSLKKKITTNTNDLMFNNEKSLAEIVTDLQKIQPSLAK